MIQIQLRRGTAVEWTSANPTLAEGDVVVMHTDGSALPAGDQSYFSVTEL